MLFYFEFLLVNLTMLISSLHIRVNSGKISDLPKVNNSQHANLFQSTEERVVECKQININPTGIIFGANKAFGEKVCVVTNRIVAFIQRNLFPHNSRNLRPTYAWKNQLRLTVATHNEHEITIQAFFILQIVGQMLRERQWPQTFLLGYRTLASSSPT